MAVRKSFNSFCVSLGNVAMYSSMEANFDLVVYMKFPFQIKSSRLYCTGASQVNAAMEISCLKTKSFLAQRKLFVQVSIFS